MCKWPGIVPAQRPQANNFNPPGREPLPPVAETTAQWFRQGSPTWVRRPLGVREVRKAGDTGLSHHQGENSDPQDCRWANGALLRMEGGAGQGPMTAAGPGVPGPGLGLRWEGRVLRAQRPPHLKGTPSGPSGPSLCPGRRRDAHFLKGNTDTRVGGLGGLLFSKERPHGEAVGRTNAILSFANGEASGTEPVPTLPTPAGASAGPAGGHGPSAHPGAQLGHQDLKPF